MFKPIAILLMEILPYWSVKNQTPSDWFYWFKFILSILDLSCASLEFDTYDQAVSLVTLLTCQKMIKLFCLTLEVLHFLTLTISLLFAQVFCAKCLLQKDCHPVHLMEKICSWQFLPYSRCSFIFFLSHSLIVCQRHFCLFHKVLFDYTRLTDLPSSVTFLPSLQNESVKWLMTFSFIYKDYINLVSSVHT